MKNGFTLVELLAVVVIISVLSLITVPIIDASLNKGRDNMSDVQEKQLIKGLKDYYSANRKDFSKLKIGETCKTVKDIQDGGFLPDEITDPKTNHTYDADELSNIKICVKKSASGSTESNNMYQTNYQYEYYIEKES